MFTGKIKEVRKETFPPDDERKIVVDFEILDNDGKKFEVRSIAFPFSHTQKMIQKELKKYMHTFNEDMARAEENKAIDKQSKKVDKMIGELSGSAI